MKYIVYIFGMHGNGNCKYKLFCFTKEFKRPHDITVANKGKDLYVGEIGPNQIWKFSVDTSSKYLFINCLLKWQKIKPKKR